MAGPVDDVGLYARFQPENLAAADLATGKQWSYAALDRDIACCATVLTSDFGLREGDRVACFARNRVLLIILHLACARVGLIYVPLNWRLTDAELAGLIADAEPGLLVQDDGNARGLPAISTDELAQRIERAERLPERPIDPDRPSLILYTSGTSGLPKGALISERNATETGINFSLLGRVTHQSRSLCDSPMFHVIGLITNIRPVLMHGGAFLVSEGFDPAQTLARIGDPALGITHFFCVPQMAQMLRATPGFDPAALRGLTALFTGGAPNPPADIFRWLDDGITMVNGYGMSENGTLIGMPPDPAIIRAKPTAAGVSTPRTQMRIVGADDQPLPPGESGEVQMRGASLCSGYWRRPEENEKAFTPDGWFRTGDIGIMDADGYLSIVDRKKDMFISGGENVYPAEIEAAVAEHADVLECAVVGVPDDRWGEVGHLVFVSRSQEIDAVVILAHLSSRLARYKVPKHVTILDALPRNGAGKVLKAQLRDLPLAVITT